MNDINSEYRWQQLACRKRILIVCPKATSYPGNRLIVQAVLNPRSLGVLGEPWRVTTERFLLLHRRQQSRPMSNWTAATTLSVVQTCNLTGVVHNKHEMSANFMKYILKSMPKPFSFNARLECLPCLYNEHHKGNDDLIVSFS